MYFDFPYLILSHFNNVILMSIWILGGLKPVKKKKKRKEALGFTHNSNFEKQGRKGNYYSVC